MRINNNLLAYNSHRQLGVNNKASQKSMERLSSGLRISRAGDDAAGLAISEKMRGQINGLKQGKRNAQDGISLLQTAEGALNETHSILQRMRELAVQAANDTNDSSDRDQIQKEINQLTSEINRIGNTTEFNTQKLFKGADKLEGLGPSILSAEVFKTSGGYTTPATSAKVEIQGQGFVVNFGARYVDYNLNGTRMRVGSMEEYYGHPPGTTDEPRWAEGVNRYQVLVFAKAGYITDSDVVDHQKIGLDKLIDAGYIDADDFSFTVSGSTLTIESRATGKEQKVTVSNWTSSSPLIGGNVGSTGTDATYETANAEITFGDLTNDQVLGKGITINNQTILFTNTAGTSSGTTDFAVNVDGVTDNQSLVAAIADQLGNELEV